MIAYDGPVARTPIRCAGAGGEARGPAGAVLSLGDRLVRRRRRCAGEGQTGRQQGLQRPGGRLRELTGDGSGAERVEERPHLGRVRQLRDVGWEETDLQCVRVSTYDRDAGPQQELGSGDGSRHGRHGCRLTRIGR